jgi:uncharacterized protein (DUF427 family)
MATDPAAPLPAYQFETSPRRVRVRFGGQLLADSEHMRLLRPPWGPPAYYFPSADVRMEMLAPSSHRVPPAALGPVTYWDISASGKTAAHAARGFQQPPADLADLATCVAFDWNAMDAWFEEDEEIFVHPRDPRHRVDVRESSRHVRVEIDGETMADTHRPWVLFETGHPVRYYVPRLDVRFDMMAASDKRTSCPYKGTCEYWTALTNGKRHEDVAWSYVFTYEDCPKIANHLCFYNEQIDLYVDGERKEPPAARPPRRPGDI